MAGLTDCPTMFHEEVASTKLIPSVSSSCSTSSALRPSTSSPRKSLSDTSSVPSALLESNRKSQLSTTSSQTQIYSSPSNISFASMDDDSCTIVSSVASLSASMVQSVESSLASQHLLRSASTACESVSFWESPSAINSASTSLTSLSSSAVTPVPSSSARSMASSKESSSSVLGMSTSLSKLPPSSPIQLPAPLSTSTQLTKQATPLQLCPCTLSSPTIKAHSSSFSVLTPSSLSCNVTSLSKPSVCPLSSASQSSYLQTASTSSSLLLTPFVKSLSGLCRDDEKSIHLNVDKCINGECCKNDQEYICCYKTVSPSYEPAEISSSSVFPLLSASLPTRLSVSSLAKILSAFVPLIFLKSTSSTQFTLGTPSKSISSKLSSNSSSSLQDNENTHAKIDEEKAGEKSKKLPSSSSSPSLRTSSSSTCITTDISPSSLDSSSSSLPLKRSSSLKVSSCSSLHHHSQTCIRVRCFKEEDGSDVRSICYRHFRSLSLPTVTYWFFQNFYDLAVLLLILLSSYVTIKQCFVVFIFLFLYHFIRAKIEFEKYIKNDCKDLKEIKEFYMSHQYTHFWVADIETKNQKGEVRRRIVGCVGLSKRRENRNDSATVVRLVVSDDCRRAKIGTLLLRVLEEFARKKGYGELHTFSNNINPDASRFLTSKNFTLVQVVRRGLMRGDLYVWRKSLLEESPEYANGYSTILD